MLVPAPLTGKRIQNYIFNYCDFIGKGNFSKCYKARNTKTNEEVAIKIVELNSLKSKKLQQLLFSEIEVLKQMNHPNVLRCLQVFTSNRNCYIITELCNDGDLQTKIKKKLKLEEYEVNNVIADVYRGLKYLASKNIVHRDLKIANIFIHNGVAKIADFGFALHSKTNFRDLNIGSPLYMSPEGILDNIYGPKTDVWAFGIMVFQLYHGKTPFNNCQTEQQLRSTVVKQVQWGQLKSDISNQIKELIINCLQVREDKRPTILQLINNPYLERIVQNRQQQTAPQLKFKTNLKYKDSKAMEMQEQVRGRSHMKMRSAFSSQQPSFLTNRPQPRMISPNKTTMNPSNSVNAFQSMNSSMNYQSNGFEGGYNNRNVSKMIINIPVPQTRKGVAVNDQSFQSITSIKSPVLFAQGALNRVPVAPKKAYIITSIVTFKQCVSILHYCRLIFKYLQCFREFTSLTDPADKQSYALLAQFLIYCLEEVYDVVTNKRVKCQGQNPQVRQKKLLEVTEEYRNKYNKQLDKSIINKYIDQKKRSELTLNNIIHFTATQSSSLWLSDKSPCNQIIVGELLLVIYSSSQLLESCSINKSYSQFQRYKQIEQTLNKNKDTFTFSNYIKHKNSILGVGKVVNAR